MLSGECKLNSCRADVMEKFLVDLEQKKSSYHDRLFNFHEQKLDDDDVICHWAVNLTVKIIFNFLEFLWIESDMDQKWRQKKILYIQFIFTW